MEPFHGESFTLLQHTRCPLEMGLGAVTPGGSVPDEVLKLNPSGKAGYGASKLGAVGGLRAKFEVINAQIGLEDKTLLEEFEQKCVLSRAVSGCGGRVLLEAVGDGTATEVLDCDQEAIFESGGVVASSQKDLESNISILSGDDSDSFQSDGVSPPAQMLRQHSSLRHMDVASILSAASDALEIERQQSTSSS